MTFAKADIIDALRIRYDHYSAQAMFELASQRAELADNVAFDGAELRAFRETLAVVGDRVGQVLARIDGMLAAAAAIVDTTIVLTGVDAADGEEVLVCGAFSELGDWNPEHARAMARTGDAWLTTVKVPADATVAFKFLRRTLGGDVIWESGDDRYLVAKPRIEATWR